LVEAASAFRRALEFKPEYIEAHNNLGAVLKEQGQLDDAVAAYRQALRLSPDYAEAFNNLGAALMLQARLDDAIAAFRRAHELRPDHSRMHSNLIYSLYFHPDSDDATIAREQEQWSRRTCPLVDRSAQWHGRAPDSDRRLRVGYLSPDFRRHVIGQNLRPLFRNHDHQSFEIIGYSDVVSPDHVSAEFRESADQWRNTATLGDEALATLIQQDGVDILVDLAQHLSGNRLPVFARQPAPVQVSFAGYPAGTGLGKIGYRVSDGWLESEIGDGRWEIGWKSEPELRSPNSDFRAERIYLLDSFWCYDPYGLDVAINEPPLEEKGYVTFGSLNNFCKINDRVLRLWARILAKLSTSRLILLSGVGSHRQRTVDFLEEQGIAPERVEFVPQSSHRDYLELYHRLDVVLDPFPYGGHTTSLDALWMGVPVVSLAGQRSVSRAGLSILSNLGLPELVAFSEDDYVRTAAELAGDPSRLAELRPTLRSRMETSVLMDGPRFARGIEGAYRAIWRQWRECAP
jgi:predicted O-linked N-acetylglucosamine transferase (SPINDLY family)